MATIKSKCAIALPGKENIKKTPTKKQQKSRFYSILFSMGAVGMNYSTGTRQ